MKLHKLMDFNRAFYSYDTLDGANCQTVFWEKMTQKEAAVQAVKKIGLNQISEIPKGILGCCRSIKVCLKGGMGFCGNYEVYGD